MSVSNVGIQSLITSSSCLLRPDSNADKIRAAATAILQRLGFFPSANQRSLPYLSAMGWSSAPSDSTTK